MNSIRKHWLTATAGAVAVWSSPALAQETVPTADPLEEALAPRRNADYLDLTANLGYSSNPFLEIGNSRSSAYGRVSARGVHAWGGERSSSSISAFVEGTTYLNDYGLKSIFALTGDTQFQASERLSLFASGGVTGDLAGQLSNRFLYVPSAPVVPDPNLPPPPVVVDDPDLFSFTGRQYRVYGQGGASFGVSERGTLTVSGGAQRTIYTDDLLDEYTTLFGNGTYGHTLSERTTVGFGVGVSQTNYSNSSSSTTTINPTVNIRTLLSENWDASAAVGVSFSKVDDELGGDDSSTSLSLDAELCRTLEFDRFCGRVARYQQSSSRAAIVTTTTVGLDWYKRLDDKQTIQLSAAVVRYVSDFQALEDFRTHHFRLAASYSRRINMRLSAGADVGVRSLRQDGPDPDADIGANLFLRYRLGDLG
jgi:hypothetical protein